MRKALRAGATVRVLFPRFDLNYASLYRRDGKRLLTTTAGSNADFWYEIQCAAMAWDQLADMGEFAAGEEFRLTCLVAATLAQTKTPPLTRGSP